MQHRRGDVDGNQRASSQRMGGTVAGDAGHHDGPPSYPAYNQLVDNTYCRNLSAPVHELISSNVAPDCPDVGFFCCLTLLYLSQEQPGLGRTKRVCKLRCGLGRLEDHSRRQSRDARLLARMIPTAL